MVDNIEVTRREQKSLDEWVNGVISQIDEIVYIVMLKINLALERVANYVR